MELSLFPRDLFAELDRLQRQVQRAFEFSPSIRGFARGGFPALNVASTPQSVEIYAFAPGLDPAKLEVSVDKGLLTITGERASELPQASEKVNIYASERFSGAFRRVISLPEDVDSARVDAKYRDGILRIAIPKLERSKPRRIEVMETA